MIFQYFPGKGLQLHPLANFGRLNGYWMGHRNGDLRSMADDLVDLAVERNGFLAWEYYFAYGGGSPPWISGMAQGTAMQALSRAGNRLERPGADRGRRRVRAAHSTPPRPRACASPQGAGDWYAAVQLRPRLYVLNGHLQAVNGLRTYAEYAPGDTAAAGSVPGRRRRRAGPHRELRHGRLVALLATRPGHPGPEASLNYHTLNRDFARNLCKGTATRRTATRLTTSRAT